MISFIRTFLPSLLLLISFCAQAQVPQKINYQAVIRNTAGAVVTNQNVGIRFSLRDGTANGNVQYSERHATATNAFGLVNLQIGTGTVISGTMHGVTWGTGSKFLQVEVDITGGSNYTTLATVELISVPYAMQADNAGSFSGTLDGEVTGTQSTTLIKPNAITESKLVDSAITSRKIATNAVNTVQIADNAIIETKLADGAVTNTKIAANAVNTAQIADNSITEAKLADNAVTNAKIAANAVSTLQIADNAITETKLADGAVTNTKIAVNAVNTAQIADNAITEPKLANNSVTNTKLAANAVNTTQIADNAIFASKISIGEVVKSFNGLGEHVRLQTSGPITLNTIGNTLTIGSTGVSGITTGVGLTSSTSGGNTNIAASLGGDGSATSLSRSDHTHLGASWTSAGPTALTLNNSSALGQTLIARSAGTGSNAAAIIGHITATTGQSVGIWGITNSSDATAAGIYGQVITDGAAKAIWGDAHGDGTYAIFGQASGAGATAGYFLGNVTVTGNLSKGGGSFKIDHPLDPTNKYLYHSFVESPDMMNVYNGNVTLDANGEATVQLPNWFEALNKDFRYQLTAIGKPSPNLYISQEVQGNSFRIAGGSPGGKVSWTITGIRHDPYAEQHRIPVEEVKPANERGSYLHPDVYGQRFRKQAAEPTRNVPPPQQ